MARKWGDFLLSVSSTSSIFSHAISLLARRLALLLHIVSHHQSFTTKMRFLWDQSFFSTFYDKKASFSFFRFEEEEETKNLIKPTCRLEKQFTQKSFGFVVACTSWIKKLKCCVNKRFFFLFPAYLFLFPQSRRRVED